MEKKENFKKGILCGLGCYVLWGVLPIYWKSVVGVNPFEILANRILWSIFFVAFLIVRAGKWQDFLTETKEITKNTSKTISLILASILITFNWGIFIWAVNAGRIIETSMGYYINPLVNVLLGVFLLGEKLDTWTKVSVVLAAIGVGNMIYGVGIFPWISFSLAGTFGFYGLIKKVLVVETKTSILLETLIISPVALAYIFSLTRNGEAAWQVAPTLSVGLLVGAGVVTAIPLLLFTAAAKLLPLSVLGFLQYFSPTLTLMVGIFIYGEVFTMEHFISFIWIWAGLLVFTINQIRKK